MSERSNLNSSMPDGLSMDKAFDRVELRVRKKLETHKTSIRLGATAWGLQYILDAQLRMLE